MVKLDGDVTKFCEFVKLQLEARKSKGETSNDIMVNLIKGYKVITNGKFKQYMA